jgi:Mrp family chromosome partitioning ATPase
MGLKPEGSLLQYLSIQNVEEIGTSFLSEDPRSSLRAVVGETRSDIPTDQLVVSQRFRDMIEDAQRAAKVVIVDSPPILPVVDGRYIAHLADLVLLVARFGATTQSDIRYACDQLQSATDEGTPIFGLLSHEEKREKMYRYSGYYADYTRQNTH